LFITLAQTGKNAWWRYLVSLLIIGLFVLVGQIPFTAVHFLNGGGGVHTGQVDITRMGINPGIALALFFLTYAVGLVGVLFVVKKIHKRPALSVITASPKFRLKRMGLSFIIFIAILAMSDVVLFLFNPSNYQLTFSKNTFLTLLFVSLLLVPLQAGFEEALFRGYLLQGFSLISKYKGIPLVLSALAFGGLHFSNIEVTKFGPLLMFSYYIFFGLFMGVLVLLDNGLEAAIGVHTAANFYTCVFVNSADSSILTPSLLQARDVDPLSMLLSVIAAAVVYFLIMSRWTKWRLNVALLGRIKGSVTRSESGFLP
jgi:uncharacterized protein